MNRKSIIIWLIPVLLVVSPSCKRTLEPEPLERFTPEYLWDPNDPTGQFARQYLDHVYTALPNAHNRIGGPGGGTGDRLDAATDDAMASDPGSLVDQMTVGGITPLFNPDDAWVLCYEGIRKSTIFIANFPVVQMRDESLKQAWLSEARFIRAFFYFELLKRYGGVPLMGDQVRGLDDDLEIPRSSFAECVDYILSEIEMALPGLRPDPVNRADEGRVTKSAALALKARVLLYAASPLFNGGNIGGSAQEKLLVGYDSYDPERWRLAAEAARAVIDLNVFELHPDLVDIFLLQQNDDRGQNKEVIWARLNGRSKNIEETNAPVGYPSAGVNGPGRTSPTQGLVDAFPMQNGLPIDDPASGYDANNPYANRDPRLTATIFYNGAMWFNRPVETFEGGADKPGGTIVQTRTGYYMRKFMGRYETRTPPYQDELHNYVVFRYAEILLNYAEALNEYLGPVPEVYEAVEAIRERAGLVPFELPAGLSKDDMRKLIRNERRIELAFEEQRYWDIRRWKIAEEAYGPQEGMRMIMNRATGAINYQRTNVREAQFIAPKMYLYPIPYNEYVKNDNMIQNPGW